MYTKLGFHVGHVDNHLQTLPPGEKSFMPYNKYLTRMENIIIDEDIGVAMEYRQLIIEKPKKTNVGKIFFI